MAIATSTSMSGLSRHETARAWAHHLMAFVLPVTCVAYLATGPWTGWSAVPWLLVLAGSVLADMRSPTEHRQPAPTLPGWPFDWVLFVLSALHLLTLVLLVRHVASYGFWTLDTFVAVLLVGVNSGYSGIVVAHELLHRPEPALHFLGRVLMGSVLYEHFATEHIRGHHARVGLPDDPATALFDETYLQFFRRTVPAQFRSAWRIESRRLGDEQMPLSDPRMLRHRVLHGVVVEWAVALAILVALGAGAFAAYFLQASIAVRLLEAVNYFEHWGLTRRGPPGDTRRLVGHRFAVHTVHAGRTVPTCRSPRLGLPPLPAAPLLGGEPKAALRILRHGGPAAGVELALPRAHDPGAAGAAAGTLRRGGFGGVARRAHPGRSARSTPLTRQGANRPATAERRPVGRYR